MGGPLSLIRFWAQNFTFKKKIRIIKRSLQSRKLIVCTSYALLMHILYTSYAHIAPISAIYNSVYIHLTNPLTLSEKMNALTYLALQTLISPGKPWWQLASGTSSRRRIRPSATVAARGIILIMYVYTSSLLLPASSFKCRLLASQERNAAKSPTASFSRKKKYPR